MKKYLVSGVDPFMGTFGGVRSIIVRANSEKDARSKAIKKFGESFGTGGPSTKEPHGINVQETELDTPPELPEN